MATTRTGEFAIGFRRGGGPWQRRLDALIAFALEHGFELIDVGSLPADALSSIRRAGLNLGTVDLPNRDLGHPDAARRAAAARACVRYVRQAADAGATRFFTVMYPEDAAAPRSENLERLADGFGRVCESVASLGVRIALEGWPGKPPHFAAFACTPADCRLVLDRLGSDAIGINFDPSHLIRLGIDPLRFVREFAPRIVHVHAKDTAIDPEGLYQHGNLQPATVGTPNKWGGHHWRYTIPGHGVAPWPELFAALHDAGYRGGVSVELEDENFNGSAEGEQRGLIASRDFLTHA